MKTLCIDIGGTGLKCAVVDPRGALLCERERVKTPRPATPKAVVMALGELVSKMPEFDRVSVGFPGVVVDGVVRTAPNLDGPWPDFELAVAIAELTDKPTRAANDADVAGLGAVEGKGVELLLTLGTGIGAGQYLDGKLIPNLELGHHPFRKGHSYEDYLRDSELKRIGKRRWNRRLRRVIAQLDPVFNYRVLYLGGGNARKIEGELPDNVRVVDNLAGVIGGVKLWQDS
ncbi:MAG: ROK family protein [Myxococcota bacterium]